jgi:hypothetical protein
MKSVVGVVGYVTLAMKEPEKADLLSTEQIPDIGPI